MSAGMVLAALAFGAATLVEVNVVKTVVDPAPAHKSLLQVYNLAGGSVTLNFPDMKENPFPAPIGNFEDPPEYKTLSLNAPNATVKIDVSLNGQASVQCSPTFQERTAYSLILRSTTGVECTLVEDNIEKDKTGLPFVRFFNTLTETINLTVGEVTFSVPAGKMSLNQTVDRGEYPDVTCSLQSGNCANLNLGLLDFGALYTFILTKEADKIVPHKMEDVKANNVHIAWQVPQYVLLTMGEVLFSITGLEFSYSQAPANMKSVLQAGWLLTVAFGNVIVLIVAEGAGLEQWIEFLLFACLLLGVCIIFSIMAHFYTYVIPEELDKIYMDDSEKEEEDDLKKTSNDIPLNKPGAGTRL